MKNNINNKLVLMFLIISLVPILVLIYLSINTNYNSLNHGIESHLETAAETKADHIETILGTYKDTTGMIATGNTFKDILVAKKYTEEMNRTNIRIKNLIQSYQSISRVRVLNKEGIVIASSHTDIGYDLSAKEIFIKAKKGVYIGDMHISRFTENSVVSVSAPILINNEFSGVVIVNFDAEEEIFKIMTQLPGMECAGEIYLIDKDGYMITPSKYLNNTFLVQKVDTRNANECLEHIVHSETEHELNVMAYDNYVGNDVLGVHAHITEMQWCLLAEIDEAKAFESLVQLKKTILVVFPIIIILTIMLSFFTARLVTLPLINLKKSAEEITKGNLDTKIQMGTDDEIGVLSKSFELMRIEVKKSRESLEDKVHQKTKELAEKLNKEEKTSEAMLYILERQKKTNTELLDAKNQLKKEKQNVEKKVVDRTKELEEEKEHVELLLEQKNQFVNQLSHDLRTPISPMLTLLPIAIKHSKDKDTRYDLEVILKNVKYLNSLVDNTLNLARLQGNTMKFDIKTIDILQIVEEVIETNKTAYKQNNVVVVNNIKDRVFVLCDRLRVREIMENIQMNSVKFMPGGGTITFGAEKNKKEVIVSISDTGIGIEKEKLEKIFEEFYKADESRHNLGGTGLGLSICKRMLKKMHGGIWVKSDGLNKGTTICFALPLGKRPDDKSVL